MMALERFGVAKSAERLMVRARLRHDGGCRGGLPRHPVLDAGLLPHFHSAGCCFLLWELPSVRWSSLSGFIPSPPPGQPAPKDWSTSEPWIPFLPQLVWLKVTLTIRLDVSTQCWHGHSVLLLVPLLLSSLCWSCQLPQSVSWTQTSVSESGQRLRSDSFLGGKLHPQYPTS